jgi:integrase
MRVMLKGVHRVRSKGRLYYYAWRGGPRLTGQPGSPEFVASYTEAYRSLRTAPDGTLHALISEFRASAEYKGLSASSKRAYQTYLDLVGEEFGDLPLEALSEPAVRGDFKQWRDRMADTPRKADYAWTVLARVLSVAKDRGRISINPCERGGRLYRADRIDCLWTEDHIRRFGEVASNELQLALVLALWTGQRQGDLLRLSWTGYDGRYLRLRQSKTGARVAIPVGETLRNALASTKRRATTILTTQDGTSWTSDGFRASWRKACERAGISDVTFHDLRGSAVVRLALAGCEVPEIAALTGHSLKDASSILDKHYLGRDVRLAEAAMRKRERKERRTRIGKTAVKRSGPVGPK